MPPARRKPTQRDINISVMRGLRLDANIFSSQIPSLTFSPTIGMVAGRIDKLGVDIRSFREPITRAIKEVMIPSFRRNFEEEGRPEPWAPLSESTIEIRSRMGARAGGGILRRTNALFRVSQQLNIWTIKPESAIIRGLPQRVWYGAIHQGGYEGGSMKAATARAGGDTRAALEAIIDAQKMAMRTGTVLKTGPDFSIPARPFIMFQDEDEDAVMEVFIKWLGERVDRHFSKFEGGLL